MSFWSSDGNIFLGPRTDGYSTSAHGIPYRSVELWKTKVGSRFTTDIDPEKRTHQPELVTSAAVVGFVVAFIVGGD